MITIEFVVILLCLLTGTRFGGMGLGLISGIGLLFYVLSLVCSRVNRRLTLC